MTNYILAEVEDGVFQLQPEPQHRSTGFVDEVAVVPVVDAVDRLFRAPQHRAAEPSPLLFELDTPEEERISLGRFLIDEKGWKPEARTVHAAGLFAGAVYRRYVAVRGEEPLWDRGWVYRGFTDYLIVRDTYDEEIGAIAEQLSAGDL